jgi:hypothetical protein
MGKTPSKAGLLRKQPVMRRVLVALLPCVAGSVYYFGWRSLAMIAFCCAWGFLLEWLFCRKRSEPVSEAVFVTAVLFALVMPPGVGWHVLAVGMGFAIIFSKEVFGGFGRNVFNPALAGRCFVYICFPVALTGVWQPAGVRAVGCLGPLDDRGGRGRDLGCYQCYADGPSEGRALVRSSDADALETIPFAVGDREQVGCAEYGTFKRAVDRRYQRDDGGDQCGADSHRGRVSVLDQDGQPYDDFSVIITYAVLNQILFWLEVKPVPGAMAGGVGRRIFTGGVFYGD